MDTPSSPTPQQPLITVLTPTYNRADLLPRLYESLTRQTDMDFEWILVDDGSADDTEAVVQPFLHDAPFAMRYLKKANGGKHTAVNLGVQEARGKLTLILDSDDELPPTSIADVKTMAASVGTKHGDKPLGGVCGYMAHRTGEVIGAPMLEAECDELALRYTHHVTGDMCEVFYTRVLREYPFPEIEGERFCPESLVWNRIATRYALHTFPKVIYTRDYLDGGLTDNIVRIRAHSPIASCTTYAEMLGYEIPVKEKVKAAINYWRFRCCAERGTALPKVAARWWWARPLGWAFYRRTCRK